MREHIRREAAQLVEGAWWLVPIAFATAAIAAVAVGDLEVRDDAFVSAAPAQAMVVVPASQQTIGLPQSQAVEVSQPVQAF